MRQMFVDLFTRNFMQQFQIIFSKMQNKGQIPKRKGSGVPTRKILEVSPQTIIKQLSLSGMLNRDEFQFIIQSSISVLKFEPNILKTTSPAVVVGDIHGYSAFLFLLRQFFDLLSIFNKNGMPPQTKYVFLGDYVDRGDFSIEVITLLFWLKLKYPKSIYLLRGNHQCRVLTNTHNFKNQCKSKYNIKIYELVVILFEVLPLCCIVDGKYFCVHAGISPNVSSIDQIQKISRFCEIPEKGVLCDLVWSDPTDQDKKQWTFNTIRSCSFFYSRQHAQSFLKRNNLQMIIRGHEVQLQGFKYLQFKKVNKNNVLTVFSAPNYCDRYNNLGAVAIIENNDIKLHTFKCVEHPYVLPNNTNIFEWSIGIISRQAVKILVELVKSRFLTSNANKDETLEEIKQKIELSCKMEAIKKALEEGQTKDNQIIAIKQAKNVKKYQDGDPTDCLLTILMFMCRKKRDQKDEAMPSNQEVKNKIKEQEMKIFGNLMIESNCQKVLIGPLASSQSIITSKENIFQKKDDLVKMTMLDSNKVDQVSNQSIETSYIFGPKIQNFAKISPKRK